MGEAGLSQGYTLLCCRGWGWGRNSGCHSTAVRKGQRTPWECSVTAWELLEALEAEGKTGSKFS